MHGAEEFNVEVRNKIKSKI